MTPKKYIIITGTSRGLGEALAKQYIHPQNRLYCASRTPNPELEALAKEVGCELTYTIIDLGEVDQSESWIRGIVSATDPEDVSELIMVHNAALLHPIKLLGKRSSVEEVVRSVQVNLMAPMRMTEALVEITQNWALPKKVLMVSSGAARKPMASWSTYCTTKAGLEMFARCLAKEQEVQAHPLKVVSLAPGVVDTLMQTQIRKQPKEIFPGVDRFLTLHADKLLSSPDEAARQLIHWLEKEDFGDQVVADVRVG